MKFKVLRFEYKPLIRRLKGNAQSKVAKTKHEGNVDLGIIKARVRMELWQDVGSDTSSTQASPSEEALAEQRKQSEQKLAERCREETAKLMSKIEKFYEVPKRISPLDESSFRIVDKNFKKMIQTYAQNIERLRKGKYEKMVFPESDDCQGELSFI